MKIALSESEPPITVEFARLHKPVLHEVKDHHTAAGPQNLGCSQKSLRRVFCMVKSLTEDHQIDRSGLDRRVLQVPLTELQIGQTIQPGLLGTELDHFFGIIHSDHRAAAPCQQLGQKPLTGAQICHIDGWQHPEQQMTKRLPRSTRPIAAVESAHHLIKIDLSLLLTASQHPTQVELIPLVLRQLLGPLHRQPSELPHLDIRLWIQPIESPLPLPAGKDQACLSQQAQMGRNARLPQTGDLLNLVDRQFLRFQQSHNPQTGRVSQGTQGSKGGGHGWKEPTSLVKPSSGPRTSFSHPPHHRESPLPLFG